MLLIKSLWRDESGAILTAELVMLGSLAVLGGVVGLSAASSAVNDELTEVASALRSLDQSYIIAGRSSCGAWTAGSYYIQPRVEESVRELCGEGEADPVLMREQIDEQRNRLYPPMDDGPVANELPEKSTKKRKMEREDDERSRPEESKRRSKKSNDDDRSKSDRKKNDRDDE